MTTSEIRLAVLCLTTFAAACGATDPIDPPTSEASALEAQAAGLALAVPAPPRPVATTDGKQHLVYELLVENVGTTPVQIDRIDVAPVACFTGDSLAAILVTATGDGTRTVPPGQAAIAFFDLGFPRGQALPHRLTQRLGVTRDGTGASVAAPAVDVVHAPPVRVGPPLRGGSLLDINGCCTGGHTRALFAFPDGLMLAQRYAIDFVRVDVAAALAGGNPFTNGGDPTLNESYLTFGAEILAVADGTIAEASDGLPENVAGVLPPFDLATAAGNHVVLAMDNGAFALYAHLQTGSVRVHAGERVRRGDVLGLVGNTGHADGPHLHFHVMDRASPLDANGLPYVFDRFALEATVDLAADNPSPEPVAPPRVRRDLLPLEGDILGFP